MSEETFDKLEFVDTPEQLQESMQADMQAQPQQEEVTQEAVPQDVVSEEPPLQQETEQEIQPTGQEAPTQYSDEEIESSVLEYISERLGRDFNSFDDLNTMQEETYQLDERVSAINDFVEKTGRPPRDWFAYQSLNTSEMDDATAVRVNMAADYPNLAPDEINMLINDKYKLDADLYSEDEIKLSRLQLKIDADKSRRQIEEIRSTYQAPEREAQNDETFIDDEWINSMSQEVDNMEGLEFDLGNGRTFSYGLNDAYKSNLIAKNTRIEEYFDTYIREDGSWDFDTLNSHRAVVDNIDAIVANAYRQGLGDGQKGLVNKAANVSMETASQPQNTNVNSVAEQLKQQLGNRGPLTIKI
tara:strand:- start:4972 stop:6042 length:1071 start_codon:yes stop_codon:yes gene_type:complete